MVKEKKRPGPSLKAQRDNQRKRTVEEAAYFRWLSRDQEHGQDVEDWLGAEKELMENIFDRDAEA